MVQSMMVLELGLIAHIKCKYEKTYRLRTAGRFFPSRNFQGSNGSFIAQRKDSPPSYYEPNKMSKVLLGKKSQRKSSISNSNVVQKTCYNFKPKLGPKVKRTQKRPMTGSIEKYKINNEQTNVHNENYGSKLPPKRAKTAQGYSAESEGFTYVSHRISTPQTIPQKRPGSRYNKDSLYSGLENGRKSPEYKVPILDMNLKEYAYHNSVMPSFWK